MTTIYIQLICITVILTVISLWIRGIYSLLEKTQKKSETIEKNNIVEFVWEDEEWNWIYRIK